MPIFDFEGPDGKIHSIEGPEGSTPAQAFKALQSHLGNSVPLPRSRPNYFDQFDPPAQASRPPLESFFNEPKGGPWELYQNAAAPAAKGPWELYQSGGAAPKHVEFEGKIHEFPADFSDSDIAKALQSLPPGFVLDRPSAAADVAKSGGIGVLKGLVGLGGFPGDVAEYGARGINAGVQGLGSLFGLNVGSSREPRAPTYGSSDITKALTGITGPLYEPQTKAGQFAETAGSFLPAAAMGPGGLARRTLMQAAIPGVASESAGQATEGTAAEPYTRVAGALASPLAAGALRRAITPLPMSAARQPAVAALQGEGVGLTAGEITGSKPLRWFEQTFGDLPGSRAAAQGSERAQEQFTAAALRRAGINADRATPEVIDDAFTRIGGEFDRLAARNTLRPDPQFGQDVQAAVNEYRGLVAPPNRAPLIENFETELGTQLARNGGVLPGDVYQSLRSRIERAARGAASQPEVAGTLRDLRGALDDAMERTLAQTNARDLGAWQQTRNQYRNMLVIEKAATGAGENAALGLISPSQLRNAAVNMGRRAYARGEGDFAELARSGEAIMKPLPQSGTAPRSYAQAFPAVAGSILGSLFGGAPGAALGGVGALAAPPLFGRLLMSRPVQGYLGNQLLPTPQGRGLLPLVPAVVASERNRP